MGLDGGKLIIIDDRVKLIKCVIDSLFIPFKNIFQLVFGRSLENGGSLITMTPK